MSEAQGLSGNPEEGEHLPLETVTRSQVKTMTQDTIVCECESVCVCVRH